MLRKPTSCPRRSSAFLLASGLSSASSSYDQLFFLASLALPSHVIPASRQPATPAIVLGVSLRRLLTLLDLLRHVTRGHPTSHFVAWS